MRLELWWQLRKLMKVGLVFRYTRKSVSIYNLPRQYVNRQTGNCDLCLGSVEDKAGIAASFYRQVEGYLGPRLV